MRTSPVYLPESELERACRFETLRRSGPGGQNRNKVETGARFYHLASGLVGEATERRYQIENRKIAMRRLRLKLALSIRDVPDLTRDLNGDATFSHPEDFVWFRRLVAGKIRASKESFDYPILVAEFFDAYAATNEDMKSTVKLLQTTSSQIIRLLSAAPSALTQLNNLRESAGASKFRA